MGRNIDAEVWQSLGEQDADWAVESKPGRRYGGWANDLEAFYASGRRRVEQALALVPEVGFGKVIDWGSGTGRLSFTLAEKYERVTAVDVSTSMQETMRKRAAERGIANLDIVHVDDFKADASHDFGLSLITMMHFSNRAAVKQALEAMVAGLKPSGWLIVEIPDSAHTLRARVQPGYWLYRGLRRLGVSSKFLYAKGLTGMHILFIPKEWVVGVLAEAGADVVRTTEDRGTSHRFIWYVAQKRN
ncbi:class I SAM-dependent DNA methyltransferase [Mycolicibacterium austroafricanum]|uniref:class I SAM-dependent DNA methyltransferase n=1 Tax=Mycolicibacterium austroafricanum TaxID=39687 RepID=UPI000CF8A81C|nr:class I SAM-dependent methyltransferase [Mycolicibacterium austroafricanum]PQP41643.1 hypothetical protein C6A88_28165 [Mycolicibacterium austroafricanum]